MAEQDVGGIALGLSLDTTGWSSGIAKAKSELEGLKRAAGNIQIGVTTAGGGGAVGGTRVVSRGPAAVAGGPTNIGEVTTTISPRFTVSAGSVRQLRTQINQQMRELAAGGQGVPINITLGRVPYATMRSEISRGIGEVPIRVKPDAGSLTAFAAVLSAMTGQTPGRARAAIQTAAAERGIPARAMGGPTWAGRPYLVGEKGPEIRVDRSAGMILPTHAKAGSIAERLTRKESDFLGNLRRASQELRPEHVKFGREWYGNARAWIEQQAARYGIPVDTARGVTAALSAGTQWTSNKTKAERVFKAYAAGQPFPYSPGLNAHVEAEAILYGRKGPVPTGPKVSQFYRNLAGDFSALTLDRWALRTATRGKLSQIGRSPVRSQIEAAYMQAASEMGLDPAEYQAAVWGLEKERAGARAGGGQDLSKYMARGGRVDPFSLAHLDRAELLKRMNPESMPRSWGIDRGGGHLGSAGFGRRRPRAFGDTYDEAQLRMLDEFNTNQLFPNASGGYSDPNWDRPERIRWGKNARGGRVGGYCFTCGTRVRNQITHQSTAKHQANQRGGSSSRWLSRQPGWAYGYRNLDQQYADPEGYEESDEWKAAFGKRYRGGPALSKVFPGGVDLKRFPRPYRLAIGKRLYGLGQQYPYTASKLEGIKAVPGDYLLRHAERIWPGSTAGATPDEIGGLENDPNRIFSSIRAAQPYILLNAGMTDQGAVDMGGLSKSMADAATHEFGHAVDDVHRAVAKRNMRGQMARAGMPSAYAPTSPSEHWAELFLERHKTGMHGDLFGPFEEGDKELYRQTRGRWRGGRAEAYRQTLLHQGGTFSMTGKPPTGRYAVATTAQKRVTDEDDPLGFLRNFREVAADSPYVGTWLHEGQIYVDPVTVRRHKRDAMKLARANEQLAIFDLKRMREIPTRAWGGPADEPRPYFDRELEEWRERQMDQSAARAAAGRTGWARGEFFGREGQPGIGMWHGRKLDRDTLAAWQTQLRESSRGPGFPTGLGGYGKINPLWLPKKALGGLADMGKYIVGEIGRELFVPKTREGDIPPDVAAQLPGGGGLLSRILSGKAARGGGVMRDVGGKGSQPWNAPEDGWIVPNRLMHRVGRHAGGKVHSHPDRRFKGGVRWEEPDGTTMPQGRVDILRQLNQLPLQNVSTGGRNQPTAAPPPPIPNLPDVGRTLAANDVSLQNLSKLQFRGPLDVEAVREQERARLSLAANRGLTGRAAAGGIGAFFLGGGQQRREAQAEIGIINRQLRNLLPRGAPRDVNVVEHLSDQLDEARDSFESAQDALAKLGKAGITSGNQFEDATKQIDLSKEAIGQLTPRLEEATKLEKQRATLLPKATGGAAQNLLAVTASGLAFNLGMQALQVGLEGATRVLSPIVDQFTGFTATGQRVTKTLADMLPQVGNLRTVIAQQGLGAGLGGGQLDFFQGVLERSVNAKAGATAAGQALDLFRAAGSRAPTGLVGGYGGLFGGNIGAEMLGGGKGLLETLAQQAAGTRGQSETPFIKLGQPLEALVAGVGAVGRFVQNATNNGPDVDVMKEIIPVTQEQLRLQKEQIEYVNNAIGRGARALGQSGRPELRNFGIGSAQAEEARRAAAGFVDPDARRFINQFADVGEAFLDASGNIIKSEADLNKALDVIAKGLTVPDQATFATAQAQALRAQRDAAAQRGQLERNTIIPGQAGLQLLGQPFIAALAGLDRNAGPGGGNYQGTGVVSVGRTQRLQNEAMADAKLAVTQMVKFVGQQLGPQAAQEFQGYTDGIQQFGVEIGAIQEQLANSQARLNSMQFAFSLKMINRQLADAKGLAGYAGGSELGRLQREQFMLSRESQRLQLESQRLQNEMAQRQINFQVAVAGFQAPGITGQERAARMQEAQVEADFAQRQLNINKQQTGIAGQQFGVEGQVFQLQTQRAVEELELQRGLLIQSHAVEQEQIAAQKQIAALTTRQAQLQAKAQSLFSEATGGFDAQLGVASQYVAQFGGTLAVAMGAVRDSIRRLTGALPNTKSPGSVGHAAGIVFDTSGTTDLTVGEAGKETVAVLRNPRRMSLGGPGGMAAPGGGGGGTIINVSITGNNISDEMDLETITRKVSAAVEDSLGRKANLLGVNAI